MGQGGAVEGEEQAEFPLQAGCGSKGYRQIEVDKAPGDDDDEGFDGATRPDGFLIDSDEGESLASDDDSDGGDTDDDSDSDDDANTSTHQTLRFSRMSFSLGALAVVLSALSLTVSLASYLRQPEVTHPSPPLRSGTSCASGQALLALSGTEPAHLDRMQLCVSEPVRWEAMGQGAVCVNGGIRVALKEGGAAELCGMDAVSRAGSFGRAVEEKSSDASQDESFAVSPTFIADEAVRSGQVVNLTPNGGVAPYQLFRNVLWGQECMHVSTVSVGHSMLACFCKPAGRAQEPLLKLCSANSDSVKCGRLVAALSHALPATSAAQEGGTDSSSAEVLLIAGAMARILVISETVHGLAAQVLAANQGALSLDPIASGNVPLNWTHGERTSGGRAAVEARSLQTWRACRQ